MRAPPLLYMRYSMQMQMLSPEGCWRHSWHRKGAAGANATYGRVSPVEGSISLTVNCMQAPSLPMVMLPASRFSST